MRFARLARSFACSSRRARARTTPSSPKLRRASPLTAEEIVLARARAPRRRAAPPAPARRCRRRGPVDPCAVGRARVPSRRAVRRRRPRQPPTKPRNHESRSGAPSRRELPGILAARRQREREEAAERERRRREDEGRERCAERPLRTLFADRPVSPPPEPESTNEEVVRLADDDARDSHEHDSRRSSSAFRAPAEANQSAEDPSSDCFDDTGDASYDVEAERAAWNAELERRRAALEAERAALEASNEATTSSKSADPTRSISGGEIVATRRVGGVDVAGVRATRGREPVRARDARDVRGEACAAVVALIRSIAPGDGEPVPESFASGAFMAVTTRTDAPLSESEIASAEAQLRDAQDPDGARMFRQLLAHFKSLAACRAMEPRRAARALADATIPHGKQRRRQRALVDRFAQLLRALIGKDTNEGARDAAHRDDAAANADASAKADASEARPNRRSVPLGGVLGDALGAPHANAKTNTTSKTVNVGTGASSSSVLVGGTRIARVDGRRAAAGSTSPVRRSRRPRARTSTRATSSRRNFAGYRLRPTRASPPRRDAEPPRVRLSQTRSGRRRGSTRERARGWRRAARRTRTRPRTPGSPRSADASANPGGHRLSDALDESSFSADDSTVSDVPATASRTTNARVGSATGRGTGKGFAIAGPTNVGSILTRAMRDAVGYGRVEQR